MQRQSKSRGFRLCKYQGTTQMKKLGRLLSIPETYTFGSRTLIVQLKENKKCAYALVIGRCSPDLDSKLQGSAAFVQAKAKADQDIVQLLLVIREHCCRQASKASSVYVLPGPRRDQHRVLCGTLQGPGRRGRDVRRCVWSRTKTRGNGARCSGSKT